MFGKRERLGSAGVSCELDGADLRRRHALILAANEMMERLRGNNPASSIWGMPSTAVGP